MRFSKPRGQINLRKQRILVTGGTGFIGAHIVEALVRRKTQVVCTYTAQNPQSYFFQKKLDRSVILVKVDVRDFSQIYHLVTRFKIDYILHLAAQALVEVAYFDPKQTLETNILGTVNVLECARLYQQIKGVIVASSDKAYGKQVKSKTAYLETDQLRGDHPYEVSKSAADLIAQTYYKTFQVPVTVTRFGNVYGEGDLNFSRIIPGLVKALVQKETLEIRSDGTFVRDFIYVKDVVSGYLALLQNLEKYKGEVFNFSSHETLSVLELVNRAGKILHKKINYKIMESQKNEIPYQSLDFAKATKLLGFKPRYTIAKVLPKVYLWYSRLL
ncbi:MAG: hypothetical protein UV61_C0002G0194 [Candidatus Gottesmanbacteria bacterium GW2011_GWB1_43_11]|uniref:NAD-dependent epimerase/dehydratase domain-containing protein n=1 Tax=Candidatus Gottesmanbacteria bacterium GW2011_GWB1_43_11 TaxID=1618446 RepID=A0A0G1FKP8_9BACT|nr:MAG: hypothetical protein UV04_C0001G0082 [Candidatus Gottesmanbacteria bacterium GW2011_GWA2_42_16]KKS56271.1 MAG: hypothetical protein UV17_C0001G0081 [Candidatus Gottesmanbacteria bacterium GW2011_GWA1_42_26]KKS82604.1 MAG: hypothetical protein UV55_C0001G0064 [Candidatus Gottesmanbacteria bacterium GW2011_GWC1_43_10]KKS87473.1 MAG: hypothetical protein UV61_C0002G0194 [Candidatus Gottesmanbacteria bacterium GW2011_GWB1_43_11]OGG10152.1 MAG: hypothetical protein A2699_01235 [Candidatus Go